MNQTLAVVVIGRNEGERLTRCLRSIVEMKHPFAAIEVIYVDSASSDDSVNRARNSGARVILLPPGPTTAARGRNAGWRSTDAELVLFLDGDTVLDQNFVTKAMAALTEPQVAVVWGHRRELAPRASLYNRVLDLDWIYPPGLAEFCGGDVLVRRKVLLDVGGFDERLIAGEEPELCRRIRARGHGILHIDFPMTGHDLQITHWSQYWKRATRAGHAYAEVSERFRNSKDPFWASDRKRNLMRGSFWLISLAVVLAGSVFFGVLPVALWLVLLLLVSVRSAWKARWKRATPGVLLLYGFHSHVQQVPIFVGQLQYELSKRQNRKPKLIEYKERRVD